jgi:hypothetical protein
MLQAIDARHNEHVTLAEEIKYGPELGAALGGCPARLFLPDHFAAGRLERFILMTAHRLGGAATGGSPSRRGQSIANRQLGGRQSPAGAGARYLAAGAALRSALLPRSASADTFRLSSGRPGGAPY